jgi:hypothetical protein
VVSTNHLWRPTLRKFHRCIVRSSPWIIRCIDRASVSSVNRALVLYYTHMLYILKPHLNNINAYHIMSCHLFLCIVLIKHHTFIRWWGLQRSSFGGDPRGISSQRTPIDQSQGRPLCIPLFAKCINRLWFFIALLCYYMTRLPMIPMLSFHTLNDTAPLKCWLFAFNVRITHA